MKWAVLANDQGIVSLGSDGKIPLDGRWKMKSIPRRVWEYRERFKTNFPHKYKEWTRFGIVTTLKDDPRTTYPI